VLKFWKSKFQNISDWAKVQSLVISGGAGEEYEPWFPGISIFSVCRHVTPASVVTDNIVKSNLTLLPPLYYYFIYYSFIHTIIHCLDHFSPVPCLPLASRQNLFYAFLQFCWRVEISTNKKDIAFLLVETRTVLQSDSQHCFHIQMCYNPGWFISNWSLHCLLIPFSCWPLLL
jgi:hypothetical protein